MEALKEYVSSSSDDEEMSLPRERNKARLDLLLDEPPGDPDPELAARLAQWRAKGSNPTQEIRQNREFANPQILQKIVEYFGINDIGSCYPKHIFDPDAIVARRAKGGGGNPPSQTNEDESQIES
mmetsp:Transcript_11438/g.15612  ORF Transcript_11438/g.15612 Transcript_11438/m.15612 type:complete len:125 (+) Transcript_11438:19-393(+)